MLLSALSLALSLANAETTGTLSMCSSPIWFGVPEEYQSWSSTQILDDYLDPLIASHDGKLAIKIDTLCCPAGQIGYASGGVDLYRDKSREYHSGDIYSVYCY